MLYPRIVKINGKDVLVDDTQCVGYREHLSINHRVVYMTGIIGIRCAACGTGDTEANSFLTALDSLSNDPIRLVITSPGGDLDTTLLLYDTMKLLKSPVETVGRYCASGAAILLAAGSKRYLYPHAKVMLHLPSGQMSGESKDLEIQHKQMKVYTQRMVDILIECGAKKSREDILADMDRDFWLEPKEAIAYGLADEIMTPAIWQEWFQEREMIK